MSYIIEKRSDNTTIAILVDEPLTFLQDGSSNSELKNHPIKKSHENKIKPPNQINQNTKNPRRYIMNQNLAQSARNQDGNQNKPQQIAQNKTQQIAQNKPQQTTQNKLQQIAQNKPQQTTQNKPQQTTQNKLQQTTQNKLQQIAQNKPQQTTQNKLQQIAQNKPQQTIQNKLQQTIQNKTQQTIQNKLQQTTQNKLQQIAQNKPQQTTQNKLQQIAQNKPQQTTQNKLQQIAQNKPQQTIQNKPQQTIQNKPQQTTQNKLQQIAQNKPQQIAHIIPQNTSNRLPYLPDHNPQTNPNLTTNILSANWPEKELPKNYVPSYYDLFLHFPENNRNPINGIVNIYFEIKRMSDHLFLNIDTNITINSIKQNGNELKSAVKYPFLLIYKAEYPYIIQSEYPIVINYTLQCEKVSNFSFEKVGFLFCNGLYITRLILNDSKKLLPCYDDFYPSVSLKLKLKIPSKLKGFSNLPVEQIRTIQNEKEIEFSRAFSRIVGFCIYVGEFDKFIEIKTNRGIPIKAFNNNDINDPTCINIIKTAAFAIEWIESKIGIKYELSDFHILFNSNISNYASSSDGLAFCNDRGRLGRYGNFLIAHEVVHQWFGSIMRIKSPNSVWLYEGFANFIAYLIMKDPKRMSIYDKSERIYTQEDFLQEELIESFHYFKKGIVYPDDITNFKPSDLSILYSKGTFIVKMFYDIIGERDFFSVCEIFLKKYKNIRVDIPEFLQIANEPLFAKKLYNFFDPWLKNIGFPFLFVEEIISDNKKVGLKITQKNYCCYQFQVPIMYEKNHITKTMNVMINNLINTVYIEFDRVIVNHNIESLCFVAYSSPSLCIVEKLSKSEFSIYKKYRDQILCILKPNIGSKH